MVPCSRVKFNTCDATVFHAGEFGKFLLFGDHLPRDARDIESHSSLAVHPLPTMSAGPFPLHPEFLGCAPSSGDDSSSSSGSVLRCARYAKISAVGGLVSEALRSKASGNLSWNAEMIASPWHA